MRLLPAGRAAADRDHLILLTRLLRDHLWSDPGDGTGSIWRSERAHLRAVQVVRMYYVIGVLLMAQSMSLWPTRSQAQAIAPLWPVAWLERVDAATGILAITSLYGVAAVAAAALPRWRITRIAYAGALFQHLAMMNSFGKINHAMFAWLWTSVLFALLPSGRAAWRSDASADERRGFLQVIVLVQGCVLLLYTFTGLWKLWYATVALWGPAVSAYEVRGFSLLIGKNLLSSGRDRPLGQLLVRTPALGWALFNATMYLETTAVIAALRPRLHRLWGFGLILFHLGTQAAMGIFFAPNVALLGLLLLCSPLAPERVDLRATALDLPGVRLASRAASLVHRARRPPAPEPSAA